MIKRISEYFIILLVIFDISGSSILSYIYVNIGLAIILAFLALKDRKLFNIRIFYILLVWLLINFFSMIFTDSPFQINKILLFSLNILIPFWCLRILGVSFWEKFERAIYVLTYISLPIFLFNNLYPKFFNGLLSIFNPWTNQVFYSFGRETHYWSSILYVNAVGGIYFLRNCGFMWEPGAFAMMIVWAIAYNWLHKGFRFDRRILIYATALATTQSTAGYLAFFTLIIAFFSKKLSFRNLFLLTFVGVAFFTSVYKFEFMGSKIDTYIMQTEEDQLHYNRLFKAVKVNRLHGFYYDVFRAIKFPFGYGYNYRSNIISVNGLSAIMLMWGIPILIYMIYLMKKYLDLLKAGDVSNIAIYYLMFSFLIVFFSNPIASNIFVYLIFLTPLLINEKELAYADGK